MSLYNNNQYYTIKANPTLKIQMNADQCYEVIDTDENVVGEFVRHEYAENFVEFVQKAWFYGYTKIKCVYDMLYPSEQLQADLTALEADRKAQMKAY